MAVGQDQIQDGAPAQSADAAWQAVRQTSDIQFSPLAPIAHKPPPQTEPPAWLEALAKALETLLKPLGELLGVSWPVLEKVLLAGVAVLVLYIVWKLVAPLLARRGTDAQEAEQWIPAQAEAVALLEDADRLAAQGRYDEAAHLLLRRSVSQIATARPDWLHPASTAREIARFERLPEAGRQAFSIIADRVERSRYALRALGAQDWQDARDAYARFARLELAR